MRYRASGLDELCGQFVVIETDKQLSLAYILAFPDWYGGDCTDNLAGDLDPIGRFDMARGHDRFDQIASANCIDGYDGAGKEPAGEPDGDAKQENDANDWPFVRQRPCSQAHGRVACAGAAGPPTGPFEVVLAVAAGVMSRFPANPVWTPTIHFVCGRVRVGNYLYTGCKRSFRSRAIACDCGTRAGRKSTAKRNHKRAAACRA